jgi:lysophospholipase L1-like esterase
MLLAGTVLAVLLAVAGLLAGVLASSPSRTSGTVSPSGTASPASPAGHAAPAYYLALGDSLSQGVQPARKPRPAGTSLGESIETSQGYADDLDAQYRAAFPGGLRLEKLGCPGETTASMLTGAGSPCTYPQGSQFAAALAFIRAHRGEIALITVDIGANDVDGCVTLTAINESCVAKGTAAVADDLPRILSALHNAAGPDVRIAGLSLYDPFLADYLTGTAGQAVARESVPLAESVNKLLAAADKASGASTADVQDAFSTADFSGTAAIPLFGTVPLNVARVCTWTWMCTPPPYGPNIHANAAGYRVIAAAFERAIGKLPRAAPAPAKP